MPSLQTSTAGNTRFTGRLRLTGLAYTWNAGAHQIDTFGWAYDDASRVTTFTSNDGTATYGYDPTNQLTSATYTTNSGGHQPANESYSFDLNGNRNSTGYTTTSPNLMSSDGTFNYQHDADGNQTVRTRISNSYATDYKTTYSWDYRNRLTDVEYFDNNNVLTKHVHFVYDVFDHLVATEVDTTGGGSYNQITRYVLDVSPETPQAGVPGTARAQPVLMFDANGNLTERVLEAVDRIFAEGSVSSLTQADTVDWDLVDNLGSVRDVLDNNSNVINHEVYSSFGQLAYESNPSVVHFSAFAGGHFDPSSGLVNDYHRWYDPATGRWTSDDPAGFGGADTNLTRPVHNAPTIFEDSTGLLPVDVHGNPITVNPPDYSAMMMAVAQMVAYAESNAEASPHYKDYIPENIIYKDYEHFITNYLANQQYSRANLLAWRSTIKTAMVVYEVELTILQVDHQLAVQQEAMQQVQIGTAAAIFAKMSILSQQATMMFYAKKAVEQAIKQQEQQKAQQEQQK